MRLATFYDIPLLVDLMDEFYGDANYVLDRDRARTAFAALLADDRLGYVWIIEEEQQAVGHVVLTLRFAMEYGGLIGCLDDFYIKPAWRGRGLATGALTEVRKFSQEAGVRALTVEVAPDNVPAQAAYHRVGFAEAVGRQLLALALANPSHIVG